MTASEIYVKLINEAVDVWRPVQAEQVRGRIYLIVDQPHDWDTEKWQFNPGSLVLCELVKSADGDDILRASQLLKE